MDSINFKFQRIQIDPQDYDDELFAEYTHELILQPYINNQYFHFENNYLYFNANGFLFALIRILLDLYVFLLIEKKLLNL